MNIKAAFFDLDNTLLRSDRTVSDYTLAVLRRCQRSGIKLAIATARPPRAARFALPGFAWDGIICHSGAHITAGSDQVILRQGVETSLAKQVIDDVLARWPDAAVYLEAEDSLYGNHVVEPIWEGIPFTQIDFTQMPDAAIDKFIVTRITAGGAQLPEDMAAALTAMLPDSLHMVADRGGIAVISSRAATKISGVQALMNHWGLPLLYASAFGDDLSDKTMLENVGWGVAVDNALPQVKAAADFTCGSNNDDGVARWLEQNAQGLV